MILLLVVGVLWACYGFAMVAFPDPLRQLTTALVGGSSLQTLLLSIVSLSFGAMLLLNARTSRFRPWMLALGALSTLKGLVFMLAPQAVARAMTDWWLAQPDATWRVTGVLVMALGGLLVGVVVTRRR